MSKLQYCGGIPTLRKPCEVSLYVLPTKVSVSGGLLHSANIPLESITDVSMRTDEQISKDVTLTRLLLLGVFAFGAKKKTKVVTNYLVIDYDCGNGVQTSAIFTGPATPKLCADIQKARMKFANSRNLAPVSACIQNTSASGADDIAKYKKLMDDGVITEDEFQAKKKQILGV